MKETSDLKTVCEDLFIREKTYFNPAKISRNQVSRNANDLGIGN